jgi:hypothetical protein
LIESVWQDFFRKKLACGDLEFDNAEMNSKKGATTVDWIFGVSKKNLLNRNFSE